MEVLGVQSSPAALQCRPCSHLASAPYHACPGSATSGRVFLGRSSVPCRYRSSKAVPMAGCFPLQRLASRNDAVELSVGFRADTAETAGAGASAEFDSSAGGCELFERANCGTIGIEAGAGRFATDERAPGSVFGDRGVNCRSTGVGITSNSGRCLRGGQLDSVSVLNSGRFIRGRHLGYFSWRVYGTYCGMRLPDSGKNAWFAAARDGSYSSDLEEPQPLQNEKGEELGRTSAPAQQQPNVKYIGIDASTEQASSSVSSSPSRPLSGSSKNGNGSLESSEQRGEPSPYEYRPKPYKNRLLGLSKLGTIINDGAEAFFKSEIRRRIFVTVVLIMASRLGYFITITGFDRRFMPGDYLSLVSGAVEELGDLVSELKLAVFQLGISPYIFSSIVMQIASHLVPTLTKLRKEGLDGNEKIKKYTWWLALAIAIVESLVVSFHSAQYSVYGAQNSLGYVMVTTWLLTTGAMTINWICEKITVAGFGQGSSLIICISILTGYSENLFKMISNLLNGTTTWVPLCLFLGCFFLITMWAVLVTEGRRKVKLQYYDFELASSPGGSSVLPEVEPYIPFNINPTGMQPVLTTTYLMALPSLVAGLTGNSAWMAIRDTLNPAFPTAPGAKPWLYYLLNAMFIFIFNVLDIMDTPKEVADYMMKIGARIPSVKPGRRTIEYLTKVQASTRFWGGLLLALLATVSTLVDYRFRNLHQGGTIGFTSMLIIVGSIVELRRSFLAYNVMPSLSKVLRRYGF